MPNDFYDARFDGADPDWGREPESRPLPGALGKPREDRPPWDERWLTLLLIAGGITVVFIAVPLAVIFLGGGR